MPKLFLRSMKLLILIPKATKHNVVIYSLYHLPAGHIMPFVNRIVSLYVNQSIP